MHMSLLFLKSTHCSPSGELSVNSPAQWSMTPCLRHSDSMGRATSTPGRVKDAQTALKGCQRHISGYWEPPARPEIRGSSLRRNGGHQEREGVCLMVMVLSV